jgi:excisionase family DNA binding protein
MDGDIAPFHHRPSPGNADSLNLSIARPIPTRLPIPSARRIDTRRLRNCSAQYSGGATSELYSLSMKRLITTPKKAAARSQAVACNHAQARSTYLVYAKSILKLTEKWVYQIMATQPRSGFHYQRAIPTCIAFLSSFSPRTRRVGLVEAARLIGVPRTELEAMAEAGKIRSMRVGRGYRFYELDLVDWIVAQPVTPQEVESATPGDPSRPPRPRRNP